MTPALTRLAVTLGTLVAWALWLGVLTGRPEPFFVVVPLLVGLAWAGARPASQRWSLVHSVDAARVVEGEAVSVEVALTATARTGEVEVRELLPAEAVLVSGRSHVVVAARAGETVRWSYQLRFPARGHVQLGLLHVREWTGAGTAAVDTRVAAPKAVRVYPRPADLRWLPAPSTTRASVGDYVSAAIGEGLEPGEIRPFAPGDRVRHVNWRATLRLGRPYVTRHQTERNADVVLMVDSLSQAGAGDDTTLHASVRAAAALAAAYLRRRDRVGLVEYGAVFRWVRPGSGHAQLERLLDTLLRAEVAFTYVARDLARVPPRILPTRALVIAVSPLLDPRFTAAICDLAARGFDLVVLAVDPVGLTRRAFADTTLVDAASRLWTLERRIELDALERRGLRVVDWDPADPIDLALVRLAGHPGPRRAAG